MKFELKPCNRGITDEELLEDLRRSAASLKKDSITYEEYDEIGHYSSRTVEVRFRSWNKALEIAGLRVTRKVNHTTLEFFENLENVWRTLGRQPRREEMKHPLSKLSGKAYERHFNGWRKGLEAFVEWVNSDEPDDENPTQQIKSIAKGGNPRNPSLRLRMRVMFRDKYTCRICGRSPAKGHNVDFHVDHIIPWSKGGKTELDNLQTLCQDCNLGKSDLLL
jgi:hypothetical protein